MPQLTFIYLAPAYPATISVSPAKKSFFNNFKFSYPKYFQLELKTLALDILD